MNKFKTIVADPPWPFSDSLPGKEGWRGASKHYKLLSVADIEDFELPPIANDAWLFLWRVSSMQREALSVCRAWGFMPYGEMIWDKRTATGKQHFGMGRLVRASHESVLIGRRGKPKVLSLSTRSLFAAPVGVHSEKPDEFYRIIEQLVPGPRVDIFARKERKGWTVIGDEIG